MYRDANLSMKMLMGRAESKIASALSVASATSGLKMSVNTPGKNTNSTPIIRE